MSSYENGDFNTKYGTITVRNPGRVAPPPNLQTYKRRGVKGIVQAGGLTDVTLQGPALRAFKEAERRANPRKYRKQDRLLPILITGVGYRSYALQKSLYENSDQPGRYANPDGSLHCEALAIDVHSGQSLARRARIKFCLMREGFHYAVPGESWHASFNRRG